ncbi:MAG: preprotein translocase subunit SecA [Deltaproteobacteria bacterium]|jgi:preprotein translocase subunit SecA|nr:preprotein translocase subunit SecA [Deltaproteobacteria bacterium]
MFSSSLTAETGAMRPGLISGCYPERGDRESGLIDRSFSVLQGTLARLSIDRQNGLKKIVAAIGRQGETLKTFNSASITALTSELRKKFRVQGLSAQLCMHSFALIREMSARTLQQRHYDVQLMGGWVMLQGQLAEMETGEGKTLAATLAAATAALAGIPVHVITVNEYLVKRDAEAMGPLYRALGLSVGAVTHDMPPEQCRAGYACDITYCSNKQVAFDYLRDRLLLGNDRSQLRLQLESAYTNNNRLGQFLLRGLCFAIVDEADSVLIDEARTPLILTRNIDSSAEHIVYRQALELARQLERNSDFFIDTVNHAIQLSLAGQQKLENLTTGHDGTLSSARQREELVGQGLHALHLLEKDRDYLVDEDKVLIVDANTGRILADRSWERGLHQMVEEKESCPLTDAREQLGRLTYQRFFRRYLRLGGMTGTAREVSSELWSIYSLRVQRIPLHRASQREKIAPQIYLQAEDKWSAVIAAVQKMRNLGRPVLIGTGSVAESELLSQKLLATAISHRVLNARQDQEEAEIVALAGRRDQITVATNMAGRGTDIPLGDGVAALGGLHVISTCRNEAKRIDRQLFGRCARQGDPGSYQAILSLDDDLLQQNSKNFMAKTLNRYAGGRYPFHQQVNLSIIRGAQKKTEKRHCEARRNLLQQDRQISRTLAFSGNLE